MLARNAILSDAAQIEALVKVHTAAGVLLPRSFAEICENIREFVVVEAGGEVIGCGALHLYGMHLAEVRSITVRKDRQKHGAGQVLIAALLEKAKEQHVTRVCLFTHIPEFFARFGFLATQRQDRRDKVYMEHAESTGYLEAMIAAGYLIKQGVPFRRAHEQVGTAVRMCFEKGCELRHLSSDELKQCGIECKKDFCTCLGLKSVLACLDTEAGTTSAHVRSGFSAANIAAVRGRTQGGTHAGA